MEVLVAYDVATDTSAGRRRLRRVAQLCVGHGQRVQKSLFECSLPEAQLEELLYRLLKVIDEKFDSLRIYRLREPRERYMQIFGVRPGVNFHDPLIA